jgi:LruC domain-containing protein
VPTNKVGSFFFGMFDDDSNPGAGRYYLGVNNLPWALNLPIDWHHPRERIDITQAYPLFADWAESGGTEAADWYLLENADPAKLFERTLTGGD